LFINPDLHQSSSFSPKPRIIIFITKSTNRTETSINKYTSSFPRNLNPKTTPNQKTQIRKQNQKPNRRRRGEDESSTNERENKNRNQIHKKNEHQRCSFSSFPQLFFLRSELVLFCLLILIWGLGLSGYLGWGFEKKWSLVCEKRNEREEITREKRKKEGERR
jgi:hypothetical protein